MEINAQNIKSKTSYTTDICIVGAGVAGIVLANELIKTNKKIIILEAGGQQYDANIQQDYKAQSYPEFFPNPMDSRLRMLGGSCNIWENSTERLDEIDFEKRAWISDSGWPIPFSDVNQYYQIAEKYCTVGEDGYDYKYWSNKSGFENICTDSQDIDPAIIKSALPPTHFYQKYGDYLNQQKNVTVIKHASLTDIAFDTEKQIVNQVTFQSKPEIKHVINAKIIVFCMGGIENARLLLHFNEKYNNLLGNQEDNVGRYFMEHPTIRGAHFYPLGGKALPAAYTGLPDKSRIIRLRLKLKEQALKSNQVNNIRFYFIPQSRRILSDGISSSHIVLDKLSEGELPDNFGQHLSNILGDIDLLADSISRKAFDEVLVSSSDDITGYQIVSMTEQTPDRNNRIILGDEKDAFGIKRIKIQWALSQSDKDQAWNALKIFVQDPGLSSWGRFRLLSERSSRIWRDQLGFAGHHIGTTKMAHSVKQGVVDTQCKVFGTKNLYIAGCSVFPTGGHVPPTLSIAALTVRLSKEISRELART